MGARPPAAEHVALTRVLHRAVAVFQRAMSAYSRTHTVQMWRSAWTVRRAEGRDWTHRAISDGRLAGRPGIADSNPPLSYKKPCALWSPNGVDSPFKPDKALAKNRQPNRLRQAKMSRGGWRSTSFRPGQSGNPTGRPKRPATIEARRIFRDVLTAARERTQDAIDTLASIMRDPKAPAAARVSAAQALLDRGYGKPAQAIEVSAEPDLTHLSDEDLEILRADFEAPGLPTSAASRGAQGVANGGKFVKAAGNGLGLSGRKRNRAKAGRTSWSGH